MVRIDRDQAIARKTDNARWSNPAALESAWDTRAELATNFIPAGARVLDLGCGKMSLRRFLPFACNYQGCDLVVRDVQTIVCDFNKGQFPTEAATEADIISMLGVLEYVTDAETFFKHLRSANCDVVLSYCATDLSGSIDRASLGWLNHFSFVAPAELFDRHSFCIASTQPVELSADPDAVDADRSAGSDEPLQRRSNILQRCRQFRRHRCRILLRR